MSDVMPEEEVTAVLSQCPECKAKLDIASELVNQKVCCPDCECRFIVGNPPVVLSSGKVKAAVPPASGMTQASSKVARDLRARADAARRSASTSGGLNQEGNTNHPLRWLVAGLVALVVIGVGVAYLDAGKKSQQPVASSAGLSSFVVSPQLAVAEPPAAGVVLWVKADHGVARKPDGTVTGWADLSSHHSSMTTTGKVAFVESGFAGKPVLRFDGGPGFEVPIPATWSSNTVSLFFVTHPTPLPRVWNCGLSTTPAAGRFDRLILYLSGPELGVLGVIGETTTDFRRVIGKDPWVLELNTSPAKGQFIYCDGTQMTYSPKGGIVDPKGKTLLLGSGFRGEIAEVLVYNRVLSETERQQVGFYLARKYGVSTDYAGPEAAYPVDLKQSREIAAVKVCFKAEAAGKRVPFRVEASKDGNQWVPIVDNRISGLPATEAGTLRSCTPVKARHLRVLVAVTRCVLPEIDHVEVFDRKTATPEAQVAQPALWPDESPLRGVPVFTLQAAAYDWIMAHNQPLAKDFLTTENPLRLILLPNGQMTPLWQIKTFGDSNFRIIHVGGPQPMLEEVSALYRKILRHPQGVMAYAARTDHPWQTLQEDPDKMRHYKHHRNRVQTISCNIYRMRGGALGVGGGNRISFAHPAYCNLNVLTHETGHCLNYNHASGYTYGFDRHMSGVAGVGNYDEPDPNLMPLRDTPEPRLPHLPAVALADLTPVETLTEKDFRKNAAISGGPLTLGVVIYSSGISLATDKAVSFTVPEGMTRFVAVAGFDGTVKRELPVGAVMEIYGTTAAGETLIARSPLLAGIGRPWWSFDVNLEPGTTQIRLLARSTTEKQAALPVSVCNSGFSAEPYTETPTSHPPVATCYPGTKWPVEEVGPAGTSLLAYWPDGKLRARIPQSGGTRHGVVREYWTNGTVAVEAPTVKGVLQGNRVEFDDKGAKLREEPYKDDQLDGTLRAWLPSGVKILEVQYKAGKREGSSKTWVATGELLTVQDYKAGLLDGLSRTYHKNGKVSEETRYVKNLKDGPYGKWFETGAPSMVASFKSGALDGKRQVWHTTGKLAEEASYAMNLMKGLHTLYFPTGKKSLEESYDLGVRTGVRTLWFDNGNKQLEEHYVNNVLEGKRTLWHVNGQPAEEAAFIHGLRAGPVSTYFPSGKKQKEETYVNGKQEGLLTQWYDNGQKYTEVINRNSLMDGKRMVWHLNGKVAEETVYSSGLYDGPRVLYYDNGQKQFEHHYTKSLMNGVCLAWHKNGQKWQEYHYRDGQLDGKRLDWFATGKPQFEESYKNGVKDGRCRQWDATGKVLADEVFKAPAVTVPNGRVEVRNADGSLASVMMYDNGRLHGLCSWYHKNGKLSRQVPYVKNLRDGKSEEWYDTGKLRLSCTYKDNNLSGKQTTWYPNGQVSEECTYSANLLDGPQLQYFDNGKPRLVATWSNNLMEGPKTMWFADGKKNLEERYSNGRLEGRRTVWHVNGQVFLDENYKAGKMTGRCRKWDARGKLLSDEVLEDDSDDSPPDAAPPAAP